MKQCNLRRVVLWLLLLAVLLGGCTGKPGQEDNPTVSRPLNTGPLISLPSQSDQTGTDVTEPTAETLPPPSLEPVTQLTAIQWQTIPQLLSLGEGNVLSCRNDYEEGKGIVNFLEVFNVYEDSVSARSQNDTPKELVEQSFPDGHFILKDTQTNTFLIYDSTLGLTGQFSAVNLDGYFSYDRKHYYFVDHHVLYRMDTATGSYARMALEYDLRLESLVGVHPDRDILVARVYLSFYNENTGIGVIDCKTGKLLLLNKTVSHLWLNGDDFYAAVPNDQIYGNDICCGSLSGNVLQMASTSLLGSDTASYTILPGSGILLHRTVDEKNLSTTVHDLSREGISSKLAQYDYLTATFGAIYLRQEQLIFGVYPLESGFAPVVIDPKVLRYEKYLSLHKEVWPALVDRSIILDYLYEAEGPELPENLQNLRLQADALEEKYGIRILMEDQIQGFCAGNATLETKPGTISDALTALDQALSQYPEGFLKQFRNGIGEGGLYFCLTGRIQGTLNPVGMTTKNLDRYVIALDISAPYPLRTVHHELWHAIEMKLSTDSFDPVQWNAANPQDFLYYGHYDNGYQNLTQWTYARSGEQCHFVDAYARINPREDRARIMEYVMSADASDLLQAPAIRQKLAMMSRILREHFNTDGWQTPHWEQYL